MVAAAELSPLHADALRELCNVCGGRAADALSQMLGERRVSMDLSEELPRAQVAARLGGADAALVACRVELAGPLRGELWLALAEADAAQLSGLLDAKASGTAPWALYETANIVASACLNAVYALTRLTVIPSVPEVLHLSAAELASRLGRGAKTDAPVLTTELFLRDATVRGRLLFVPHAESVTVLLGAMGVP